VRSADVTLWSQRRLVFKDFLEWTTAQQQPDKVEGFERQVKENSRGITGADMRATFAASNKKIKSLAVIK
jgi:hypothetical protein